MDSHYKIIFDKINIIEKIEEYNVQTGGYEEMAQNQIINLWQNPDYNEKFLNFYSLVNKYLRGIELEIKSEWLSILKLNSKRDFYDFMVYYVNRLTNIIYKNVSDEKKVFYRGEHRKSFNYRIGDTLFYPSFQSVSSSLSTALKFAESDNSDVKLLFVIEIPRDSHYKVLTTKLKTHDYKKKITYLIDESEYIVMSNSYYVIVDKFPMYNNVNIIKMRLYHQEYYQITNNELYKEEVIYPTVSNLKNFNSQELNKFIKKSEKYQKMINVLNNMKSYQIGRAFYYEMTDSNNSSIFNLDVGAINKIVEQINNLNIGDKAEEIKTLGLGYYDYQIENILKYKKRIQRINLIVNTEFKPIDKMVVYGGFNNWNREFKKPEFVEFIKNKKINEEFEYDKILITRLEPDGFLYEDIYNMDYPHKKIQKGTSTKLIYYKYVVKFYLSNIKICICSTHDFEDKNNVILIPNFKMKIIERNEKINRFKLPYIEFKINLSNR
jgi:hypothetical protein